MVLLPHMCCANLSTSHGLILETTSTWEALCQLKLEEEGCALCLYFDLFRKRDQI